MSNWGYIRGQSGTWYNSREQSTMYHNIPRRLSLCCLLFCTCVLGILTYEQIYSAARNYSLCVRLHSSGMRPAVYWMLLRSGMGPAVYCLLLRIGIPNENKTIL